MPVFVWEGRDRTGKAQKGEIEAANEQLVRNQLRNRRIVATRSKTSLKASLALKSGGRENRESPQKTWLFSPVSLPP